MNKYKKKYVSVFIAVFMIIIFSLYTTKAIVSLPCDKNMTDIFLNSFIHIDSFHLFINLYTLYTFSRIEILLGTKKFFMLITFLLFMNTIFKNIMHKITNKIPCSIGFSGVLFGIMSWEIVTNKGFDINTASSIMLLVILPSLQLKNISFTGHFIGAISGIISGLLFNKISKL